MHGLLVPLDGSDMSTCVFGVVDRLLDDMPQEETPQVVLVQAVDPKQHPGAGAYEVAFHNAQSNLSRLSQRFPPRIRTTIRVERGDPAECIVACAEASQARMVVMATHGHSGVERLLRGSVAERVLRSCPVPLLLLNPRSATLEDPFRRVLVPLDGSEVASGVLLVLDDLTRTHGSQLVLLRVDPDTPETPEARLQRSRNLRQSLEPFKDLLKETGHPRVGTAVAFGPVAHEILEVCARENASMIAMSSHGRSGVSRWLLGSVAENVLRHCEVPILIRRAEPGERG
jgi:nucleotide-binding universal stress UspA family protein